MLNFYLFTYLTVPRSQRTLFFKLLNYQLMVTHSASPLASAFAMMSLRRSNVLRELSTMPFALVLADQQAALGVGRRVAAVDTDGIEAWHVEQQGHLASELG